MSPDDEEGAYEPDGVAGGPPPQPADRPWVHPSELQSFVATTPAPAGEARPREWVIGLGSAAAAVVVTLLVLVAFGALGGEHRHDTTPPAFPGAPAVVDYSIAQRVAADTAPSVVTLRVVGADGQAQPVGSGVVVSSDRVVTNAHLVQGAAGLDLVTDEGHQYPARVVGTDPQTDLAVLAVSGVELPAVSQGETTGVDVGTTVIAVAATRAGSYRADIDVISDENRMVDAGSGTLVAGLLETGIQPGSAWSGGALVDSVGNLVGVLTQADSPSGLGLVAIPMAAVRDVRDQLEVNGTVNHGWLGVVFGDDAVERPHGGAKVAVVIPGSPADKGGLVKGDIVTNVGDEKVGGQADAVAAVRALRPQDPIEVGYVDPTGQSHRAHATLATPDAAAQAFFPTAG
jgi:putative serine protease PepD